MFHFRERHSLGRITRVSRCPCNKIKLSYCRLAEPKQRIIIITKAKKRERYTDGVYTSPSDIIQHLGGKSPIPILLRMHNACELRSIYPTSTLDAPQGSRFIERAIDGTSVKKQVVQPAIQVAHGWKATKESSMPRRYGCFKQAECSEIRTKLIHII